MSAKKDRVISMPTCLLGREDEYKALFPTLSDVELGEIFGMKKSNISRANRFFGLKKSKEYISEKFGPILREVGKHTRYVKGNEPKNKGKKWFEFRTEEAQQKCLKTTFKKGNAPHNTKPIGHERITEDGYIEIKVKNDADSTRNFKLKHVLFYEMWHGKVPDDSVVTFKNGNKTDFSIDNLVLLKKHENLLRNNLKEEAVAKRFLGAKNEIEAKKIVEDLPDLVKVKQQIIKHSYTKNQNNEYRI